MLFLNIFHNFLNSVCLEFQLFCLSVCLFVECSLQLDFEDVVQMLEILYVLCVCIFYFFSKSSSHFGMFSQTLNNDSIALLNLLFPPLHIFFEVDHIATLKGINFLLIVKFNQPILFIGEEDSHKMFVLLALQFLDYCLQIRLQILFSEMFGLQVKKIQSCLFCHCFFKTQIGLVLCQILNINNPLLHIVKSLVLYPFQGIIPKCVFSRPEINLTISGNFLPKVSHIHHPILICIVAQIRLFCKRYHFQQIFSLFLKLFLCLEIMTHHQVFQVKFYI